MNIRKECKHTHETGTTEMVVSCEAVYCDNEEEYITPFQNRAEEFFDKRGWRQVGAVTLCPDCVLDMERREHNHSPRKGGA